MILSIRKYNLCLLTSMLLAFLGGTFQDPLLDGMHYVSHLVDEFTAEFQQSYYNHQHEDGQVHAHRHLVLEVINDSLDEHEQNTPLQEDQHKTLKKKKTEYRSIVPLMDFALDPSLVSPIVKSTAIPTTFISVPTPPPEFFHLG